jgi:hypothetical protein
MLGFLRNTIPLLLLLAAAGFGAFASEGGNEDGPKTRILFIGKNPDHPYGSHMYMHTCGVLAKCVELTPNVEAVVSNGWPKDAKTLEGVKAIVIYTSPAAEFLLDGEHRNQVDELITRASAWLRFTGRRR